MTRFASPKIHLHPTPYLGAGPNLPPSYYGAAGSGGVTEPPTAGAPGILTEQDQGIETEDGRVILGN